MLTAITKYMPRWLMAIIATALVLATVVGSSQDSAEAIDPADTDTVYIADGTNFADALMGATIASLNTSPMLGVAGTNSGDVIPGDTVEELDRLTDNKADLLDTIFIFGGNQAVSDSVASQLGDWANDVQRIEGDSRWGTYEAISQMLPSAIDEAIHAQEADNADTLDGFDSSQLRFVNLQLYGLNVAGGATHHAGSFGSAGIALPDSGTPHFDAGFTVPPDYTPGDAFTVHLTWYTSDTSCGFDLRPNFTSFARVGQTFPGGSATAGLSAVDGTVLTAPGTAEQVSTKQYTLESPDADDLEPNDSVAFGFFRESTSGDDTCTGDLMVHSVALSY